MTVRGRIPDRPFVEGRGPLLEGARCGRMVFFLTVVSAPSIPNRGRIDPEHPPRGGYLRAAAPRTSIQGGSMATHLKPGDPAPEFSAPTSDGRTVTLSDLLGPGGLVIFFYVRDNTPG